jgi:hypothetical protein
VKWSDELDAVATNFEFEFKVKKRVKWCDDGGRLAGDFAGWSRRVKHKVTAKQTIKIKR